jgi:hypothetical protein
MWQKRFMRAMSSICLLSAGVLFYMLYSNMVNEIVAKVNEERIEFLDNKVFGVMIKWPLVTEWATEKTYNLVSMGSTVWIICFCFGSILCGVSFVLLNNKKSGLTGGLLLIWYTNLLVSSHHYLVNNMWLIYLSTDKQAHYATIFQGILYLCIFGIFLWILDVRDYGLFRSRRDY